MELINNKLDKLYDVYEITKINTQQYAKNLNNIINIIIDNNVVTKYISDKYDNNMTKYINEIDQTQHMLKHHQQQNIFNMNSYIIDYEVKYAINDNKFVYHKNICAIDGLKINVKSREILIGSELFILLNSNDIIIYKSDPCTENVIIDSDNYIDNIRLEIDKINQLLILIEENLAKIMAVKANILKYTKLG